MKKSLREILAPMTTKERFSYLWHYYRFHLIGAIVLILTVVSIASSIGNQKDSFLQIVILGEKVDPAAMEELKAQLNEELLSEEELDSSEVKIQSIPYSKEGMDPTMAAGMQKFAAELSTASIDVLIVPKDFFDQMNRDGQLLPLKDLGVSDIPEGKGYPDSTGEDLVGMDIESAGILATPIYEEDMVLCVPVNTKQKDAVVRLFEHAF